VDREILSTEEWLKKLGVKEEQQRVYVFKCPKCGKVLNPSLFPEQIISMAYGHLQTHNTKKS